MKNNYKVSVSLWTLTVKEIRRFLRIWVQTLVPPAVTMSLYFVMDQNGPHSEPVEKCTGASLRNRSKY